MASLFNSVAVAGITAASLSNQADAMNYKGTHVSPNLVTKLASSEVATPLKM